jgi:hypothetical protein
MRSRYVLGFLAMVLALVGTGNAAVADPAGVTAACRGNSCSGKEPIGQGCGADSKTMDSFIVLGASAFEFLIEFRYSPACDASWTRISHRANQDCNYYNYAWHEGVTAAGRYHRTANVSVGPNCTAWTVMIGTADKSTRACGYSPWEGRSHCGRYF